MAKVRIVVPEGSPGPGLKVFVDGQEMKHLTDVRLELNVCEIPRLTLTMWALDGIEVEGDLEVLELRKRIRSAAPALQVGPRPPDFIRKD